MVTTFPFASNEYMVGENREDRVAVHSYTQRIRLAFENIL